MDRIGQNGLNRTKKDRIDQIKPMWTEYDQCDLNGLKWTDVD